MNDYESSELVELFKEYEKNRSWNLVYQQINQRSCLSNFPQDNSHSIALKVINRSKNRYNNIIPYDHSLVHFSKDNRSGYINASFVSIPEYSNRRYILTQGPLQSTISDFWHMIWEHKCPLILMLNRFIEKGVVKCAKYLPPDKGELNYALFSVRCSEQSIFNTYIERTIILSPKYNVNSKHSQLTIKHINYNVWPDFGVPVAIDNFLLLLHKLRSEGYLDNPEHPPVIHCSAGAGRSGAFAVIDLAIDKILTQNSTDLINLTDLICKLRTCRMGLIQTPDQLRFCFKAILRAVELIFSIEQDQRHHWHELLKDDASEYTSFDENVNASAEMQSWSNSSVDSNDQSSFSSSCESEPETALRHRNKDQLDMNEEPSEYSPAIYRQTSDPLRDEARARILKRKQFNREHIERLKRHLQVTGTNKTRLPNWIRRPLSRFYANSGLVNDLRQAACWTAFGFLAFGIAAYVAIHVRNSK